MFFIDKPEIVILIIKSINCIRLTIFKTFNTVSFSIFYFIFTFSYHHKVLPILIIINIRKSSIVTEEMNTNVAYLNGDTITSHMFSRGFKEP